MEKFTADDPVVQKYPELFVFDDASLTREVVHLLALNERFAADAVRVLCKAVLSVLPAE